MRKRNNEKIQTGLQRYAFGYGDKEGVPKIMFWDFKKGCHYTFMMNDFKSEIDIHRTSDTKSLNHHVGILKIKYYTCVKLLQRYEKTQIELLKKYFFSRTINLEELNEIGRAHV